MYNCAVRLQKTAMAGKRKGGQSHGQGRASASDNPAPALQVPKSSAEPTAITSQQAGDIRKLLVAAFQYRHLLRNMANEHKKMEDEEERVAPNVKGRRAAALLARLWADRELNLQPRPQKVIGSDLGLGEGDAGRILAELREPGPNGLGCVEMVGDRYGREHCYRITDEGERQLEGWVLTHSLGSPFLNAVEGMSPDAARITKFIEMLKSEVKRLLAS